jgi:HK97 family phage major capsid protein
VKLIAELRAKLATLIDARNAEVAGITADEFTEERAAQITAKDAEIDALNARIGELVAQEERIAAAAQAAPAVVVSEPNPVYRRDNGHEVSFLRDTFNANVRGDAQARERLVQSQVRALSTSAGAGGQMAPPLWLVEDFVALARPGRVSADAVSHDVLPSGVSSINLPTVASGTAEVVQAAQNTGVQMTDLTTSSVSSSISTIAGGQIVSLQLLNQSGIPFDRIVLGDLARAYAQALDVQVLSGTGANGQLTGILNTAGVNAQTYTDASPAFAGSGKFYSQVVQAAAAVAENRFLEPTVILMHPRRWAWITAQFDTTNRPLVVPNGPAFNQPGEVGGAAGLIQAQGAAGTLGAYPVLVDPNIPTNLGAGTNQDPVIVMRADDLWLYESAVQSESFDATYANQASVLFRVLGYSAFIPNRYPKSIAVINGTGLATPTF